MNAIYVDVRTEFEVKSSHVKGCLWLPLEQIMADPKNALDYIQSKAPDKKLLIYCRSGSRSGFAAQILRQYGANTENAGGLYMLEMNGIETATGLPVYCEKVPA